MKNTVLKWILLILLMGYTAWVTVWANREAERHKCTGVIVNITGSDNPKIIDRTRSGIEAELKRYKGQIVGMPVHNVDTRGIADYLSAISNFESVDCMISSDNHLLVEAKPLEPVMRVFDKGRSYYINREGKRIEAKAEFFSDVPVVTGNFSKTFTPREVLPLVRFIEKDARLANLVGMVAANDNRNLILVPRIKGHVINFGDTSRMEEKAKHLFLFYRKVIPYKGWAEYDTISVKFRGQIVATRRDKTKPHHSEDLQDEFDMEEHTLPDVSELQHQPTTTDIKKQETQKPVGQ